MKKRKRKAKAVKCPSCLWREVIAVLVTLAAVGAVYLAALNGVFGVSD